MKNPSPGGEAGAQLSLFDAAVRERSSARARRIRVDVKPDGGVVLTVPRNVPRVRAWQFLEENRDWIERTRARLARSAVSEPWPWQGPRERQAVRLMAERQARAVLDEESARLGLRYRTLRIRDPRTRWGSCGAEGSIMLSLRLVMAPAGVMRYVAVHELCHLRWRGHGPRFWALVARQMPDYGTARDWLRRNGARLQAIALA